MIFYLLLFIFLYHFLTTAVLIRNLYEFKALKDHKASSNNPHPFVSICIPARNEEAVIERCVTSALKQDYEQFEVLVLDDNSTDNTTHILSQLSRIIANLSHLKGREKPVDWLGKPWACHQLSEAAKGDILVFVDADVWLEPTVLSNTVSLLNENDAITIWPEQKLESFWENMIIPLIYFALFTLLPAKYVERLPRWMPSFLHNTFRTKFVAACGQFFAFNKTSYDSINGHESVKDQVVEDMELAKTLKSKNMKLSMMHGEQAVYCRMYTTHNEIWNGFKKNFLAGFNNLFEFHFMWTIHSLVYILPILIFTYLSTSTILGVEIPTSFVKNSTIALILSIVVILAPIVQRMILSRIFRWNPFYSIGHVLSVIWFHILAMISITDKLNRRPTKWKGRDV